MNPTSVLGQAVTLAHDEVGTPYRWGGFEPGGFDCSGLVYWIYRKVGIANVPRTADLQQKWTVPTTDPQPGDLVFFDPGPAGLGGRSISGGAGHVGIYVGPGQMIDAPHQGTDVQVQGFSTDPASGFLGYGRAPNLPGSGELTGLSIPGIIKGGVEGAGGQTQVGQDVIGALAEPFGVIGNAVKLAQVGIPNFLHRLGLMTVGVFCIGLGLVIVIMDVVKDTALKGLRGAKVGPGMVE